MDSTVYCVVAASPSSFLFCLFSWLCLRAPYLEPVLYGYQYASRTSSNCFLVLVQVLVIFDSIHNIKLPFQ